MVGPEAANRTVIGQRANSKPWSASSEKLETKLAAGTANDAEQRQLLRLRLAMGDQTGAIKLLEPLSDQNPEQPSFGCCWRISRAKTTTTPERNGRFVRC